MQHYSIHIEVDRRGDLPEAEWDRIMEGLERADMHPSAGMSPRGFVSAQVSPVGESLTGAILTTVAVFEALTEARTVAVEAMTHEEFAAREGFVPIPELVSVPDAAAALGVSRQRILQMIEAHSFPTARKVGTSWVIAWDDVQAKVPADAPVAVDASNMSREEIDTYLNGPTDSEE